MQRGMHFYALETKEVSVGQQDSLYVESPSGGGGVETRVTIDCTVW